MENYQMGSCIFLTFDDSYYNYARICLNSLMTNYPEHPPVRIIYTGSDSKIVDALSKRPKVEVLNYDLDLRQFDGLNVCHLDSTMVYARFILWTDILSEFDKVLYLDCDTIILKPFPELFERNGLFAVSDNGGQKVFHETKLSDEKLLATLEKDKINFEEVSNYMANSGFFILPREYRTKEHLEQLWAISKAYNEYISFADQSIISIWMYLNGIKLSNEYQYNFQTHFLSKDALRVIGADNIKVMHYSGWKPDKNFDDLLIPAKFVLKVMDNFTKYNELNID